MRNYRLNSAERVPITLIAVPQTKTINGKTIISYTNTLRLVPDKVYKTDDEAMLKYLEAYKVEPRYTAEIERALKENNVPYELVYCKSCGGRIKKISYHPVEVEE